VFSLTGLAGEAKAKSKIFHRNQNTKKLTTIFSLII